MSQVDYVDYLNNIILSILQLVIVYIVICLFYVQVLNKIVSLRKHVYLRYINREWDYGYLWNICKGKILGCKFLISLQWLDNVEKRKKIISNIMLQKKSLKKKILIVYIYTFSYMNYDHYFNRFTVVFRFLSNTYFNNFKKTLITVLNVVDFFFDKDLLLFNLVNTLDINLKVAVGISTCFTIIGIIIVYYMIESPICRIYYVIICYSIKWVLFAFIIYWKVTAVVYVEAGALAPQGYAVGNYLYYTSDYIIWSNDYYPRSREWWSLYEIVKQEVVEVLVVDNEKKNIINVINLDSSIWNYVDYMHNVHQAPVRALMDRMVILKRKEVEMLEVNRYAAECIMGYLMSDSLNEFIYHLEKAYRECDFILYRNAELMSSEPHMMEGLMQRFGAFLTFSDLLDPKYVAMYSNPKLVMLLTTLYGNYYYVEGLSEALIGNMDVEDVMNMDIVSAWNTGITENVICKEMVLLEGNKLAEDILWTKKDIADWSVIDNWSVIDKNVGNAMSSEWTVKSCVDVDVDSNNEKIKKILKNKSY